MERATHPADTNACAKDGISTPALMVPRVGEAHFSSAITAFFFFVERMARERLAYEIRGFSGKVAGSLSTRFRVSLMI
jgi:hypothetical protein